MNEKKKMVYIIILCLLFCFFIISCKKNTKDSLDEQQTISQTPTTTITPTKEPTITTTPVNPNLLSFEVEEIPTSSNVSTPYMSRDEFPIMDGSTANIPLGEAVYQYLTGATLEQTQEYLKFYKTPDSYRRLINREADILLVYEPSQIILEEIKASNVELLFKPLGRDALVFIANENNPVNSLTKEQIIDIYTGKTTNWSEVGGDDMEILPFQRPAESGSQTLMEKLAVSADIIMNGPQVIRPSEMGELIDVLASYNNKNNALGYSVYFYAKNMYTKPGLKFIEINGVMPTNETIQKGHYPYVNDFYVVIRKDEPDNSKVRQLYDWLTTKEAQEIVVSAGYVPVIDIEAIDESTNAVYKNPPLNLDSTDYIIFHDKNSMQVYLGDSLLDKNLEILKTFPGKYIVTNGNLVCNSDDILLLRSMSDKEYDYEDDEYWSQNYQYELYDLRNDSYLTKEPYDAIYSTDYGLYLCKKYDYTKEELSITIYRADGTILFDTTNSMNEPVDIVPVKNNLLYYHNQKLSVIDYNGVVIIEKDFDYTGNFTYEWDSMFRLKTDFAVFSADQYIYLDENGDLLNLDHYLTELDYVKEIPKGWCNAINYCADGYYYATGNVKGHTVILREDGKVIFDEIAAQDQLTIWMYKGLFTTYNQKTEQRTYYDLNGNYLLDDLNYEIFWTNIGFLIYTNEGLEIYVYETGEKYAIQSNQIDKTLQYAHEGPSIPQVFVYWELNEEGDSIPYTCFKDIVTFEGYGSPVSIQDQYYILNMEDNSIVLDAEGKILYESKKGERVTDLILGDEIYLCVTIGNYTGIKDMQGNFVYRQYSSELSDD